MPDIINVLVLEDNQDDVVFIIRTLEMIDRIGFKVTSTIKEFYNTIDSSVHMCILDYTLPNDGGFNGVDVAKELKRRNAGTSIIFFTGNDDPDILLEMNNCCDCKIIGKWQKDKKGNINCFERLDQTIRQTIEHAKANVRFINYLMSKQ